MIGKDLINDDNIAIIELVKNAYDANSKKVTLQFEDGTDSKIKIIDDGSGMDENDIKEKWLNIAYSDKTITKQKIGAYYAGNKGVGRFSCDRLGSTLDMITKTKNGVSYHLHINWTDFEKEGEKDLTIEKIPVTFGKINNIEIKEKFGLPELKNGTALIISGLRSDWHKKKLVLLKRNLAKFINPNQLFSKEKFTISLIAGYCKDQGLEYHKQVNGFIKNQIFEKLQFKATYIESKIDTDGKHVEYDLYHNGECVFKIKEKNTAYENLNNINLVVYFLNQYKKSYFKRQTGISSVDFGSIFLFLNGFRVAPYGERGDDWLGLDMRKTQGIARFLSSRDVVGRIEIVGREKHFKPVSSREGLKSTPEFETLKKEYFFNVFRKLEKFVVDGLDWDSIPKGVSKELKGALNWKRTEEKYTESWDKKSRRIAKAIMTIAGVSKKNIVKLWFNTSLLNSLVEQRSQELQNIINNIEAFDGGVVDPNLKKDINQIGKILSDKETELKQAKQKIASLKVAATEHEDTIGFLEKKKEEYRAQTLFLKSISTLDEKTLLGFHHQICLDSNIIDNYIGKAMNALRGKEDIVVARNSIEKISKANKKIMATAKYAIKANFKSEVKKEITDLPAFFEQYLDNVTRDFTSSGLRLIIDNQVSEPFEVKARRIELSILIDNLVSNASKALAHNLAICLKLRSNNQLVVSFSDDGRGLDESISLDDVFDIGVTSTMGSGLGLFHAKEIVESLEGTIQLIPNDKKGMNVMMVFIR